jgi:hypothetical protein
MVVSGVCAWAWFVAEGFPGVPALQALRQTMESRIGVANLNDARMMIPSFRESKALLTVARPIRA